MHGQIYHSRHCELLATKLSKAILWYFVYFIVLCDRYKTNAFYTVNPFHGQNQSLCMATEALEPIQALETLCEQVSAMDDRIGMVAVLNRKGRVVEMIGRDDGMIRDLAPHKREMLFMEFVLLSSMNKEYDEEFGPVKCIIIQREKVSALSFQVFDHLLVAITKPTLEPVTIRKKICEAILNGFN